MLSICYEQTIIDKQASKQRCLLSALYPRSNITISKNTQLC